MWARAPYRFYTLRQRKTYLYCVLRHYFIFLLVPLICFVSCKKAETALGAKTFTINDVHDVAIGGDTASYLVFNVSLSAGNTEKVVVSIEDLPAGIDTFLDLAGGTPSNLYHVVEFTQTGVVVPGTYPIKIVATSMSYTMSVTLNLVVHPLNGWSIDNKIYRKSGPIERSELLGAHVLTIITNDALATLSLLKSGEWPTADGSYHYRCGDPNTTAGTVSIEFSDQRQDNGATFANDNADTTVLTLLVHNGKAQLDLPETIISNGFASRSISISVKE